MRRGLVLLAVSLTVPGLRAGEPAPARFVVYRADGEPVSGVLDRLTDSWSVGLVAERGRVNGADLLSLRRADMRLPPRPTGPQVIFANGDQVPGELVSVTGERLRLRLASDQRQELDLPLAALSALWLAAPEAGDDLERLRRRWTGERRTQDRVQLRNGDVLEGALLGLDDKTLQLEVRRKPVRVPRDRVAAVALNTTLIRFPVPRGVYGHLVLANGARLALASARCDDGRTLSVKTLVGVPLSVPLDRVAALDLRQGRAAYLSDRKPRAYLYTSYLDQSWPYVADGSATGHDLRLGGATYDKGVGVHSQSRLIYDLSPGYDHFEAVVGFDDGGRVRDGAVRVKVLVDGKAQNLGWDGELTARDAPRRVQVHVASARELTLVVEFGRRGSVNGRIDWADARLVK